MKNFKLTQIPVALALFCLVLQPARAQWNQNSSAGTFSYTSTANWNGGVINNASSTNVTSGLTIQFSASYALSSQMLLGWSNNANVTFQSASSAPETIQFGPGGGIAVTNSMGGIITIGGTSNPLILDLDGSANCIIGGVAGTSGSVNTTMNINAQIIDSVGGSNMLKLSGDRVFANLLNTNNSFVGPVNFFTLRGGAFANIKPIGGGPSALGAPTDSTNGTISATDAGSNGSLRYLGSGDTSDRPFIWNLTFSNQVANAYQLANAGTGLLQLSGQWTFPTNGTTGTQFIVYATNAPIELDGYIHGSGNANGTFTFISFTGGPGSTSTNRINLTGLTNDFRDFMISNVVLNYNSFAPAGTPCSIGAGTNVIVGGGSQGFGGWLGNSGQGSSLQYIGTSNITFTRNIVLNGTGFYWALDNAGTNTVLTWSNTITWNQGTNASVSFNPRYVFINPLSDSTNAVYSYIPDAGIVTGSTPVGVTLGVGNPWGTTLVNGGVVQLLNPTNTFAGGVQIAYARTVQAVALGNIGQPSSIGTGTNGSLLNATQLNGINLGSPDSSRGGFLSYIGTTNASCNQQVTMFGPTFNTATTEVVGLRNDSPNNSSVHFSNTNAWTYENQGVAGGTNGCEVSLSGVAVTTNTLDAVLQDVPNSSAVATPNSGNLSIIGSAWRLTAAQTYSGTTMVANATLIVNGSIASGLGTTVAAGGTLAGVGTINETVNVLTNATLAAGDGGIGTLTINGNVTNAGTVFMKLNKQAGTNDQIALGANTFNYGSGVLMVTNLAGTLAVNDSFPLFPAGAYMGTFSSISPATPGPGLAWDMSQLPISGKLKVMAGATPSSPIITSFSIAGANLTLSGTNGTADASYNVIGTTNVAQPLSSWTNVTSSAFNGSGDFSVTLTNAIQSGFPHQFFRLQVP
jgi:fibronectin-binding autotransporter adhesin